MMMNNIGFFCYYRRGSLVVVVVMLKIGSDIVFPGKDDEVGEGSKAGVVP